jgi:hypothetical protein
VNSSWLPDTLWIWRQNEFPKDDSILRRQAAVAAAGVDETQRHYLFPWIAAEGAADSVVDGTDTLGIFAFLAGARTFSATLSNES